MTPDNDNPPIPPHIFDHGNSPDSLQWLAHVKAWGWPFRAFDDPRNVKDGE